ncbi:unnamed protein product [Cercopithifilaria johnstoni]|uniref:Uncharacterized protein n=1 Tax=Cercopithifilaria johnstoni TaxID=2874296 RepID=A0A8J2MKF0_9BILA|nr:unnamed protein product [Cercopithifilaria johnstoni]
MSKRSSVSKALQSGGNLLYNHNHRRGTLADPTYIITAETAFSRMHANCFLLIPLLPLYQTSLKQKIRLTTRISEID